MENIMLVTFLDKNSHRKTLKYYGSKVSHVFGKSSQIRTATHIHTYLFLFWVVQPNFRPVGNFVKLYHRAGILAEKSSWDQHTDGKKLGLVWRNRKKISQIINDYLYLPFFLLIILWVALSLAPPAFSVFRVDHIGPPEIGEIWWHALSSK